MPIYSFRKIYKFIFHCEHISIYTSVTEVFPKNLMSKLPYFWKN